MVRMWLARFTALRTGVRPDEKPNLYRHIDRRMGYRFPRMFKLVPCYGFQNFLSIGFSPSFSGFKFCLLLMASLFMFSPVAMVFVSLLAIAFLIFAGASIFALSIIRVPLSPQCKDMFAVSLVLLLVVLFLNLRVFVWHGGNMLPQISIEGSY